MKRFWTILFLLLWSPVGAAAFFVELSEHGSKVEAEEAAAGHGPEGEAFRVTRRFVKGSGWRYLVRVDGFKTKQEAVAAAKSLRAPGQVVLVYGGSGYRRHVVARVGEDSVSPKEASPVVPATKSLPSASSVLRQAAKAHGGRGGGAHRLTQFESIQFSFDSRTVVGEDEWKIRHHFYRQGALARLEVDMLKGDGISNTVVVGEGAKAWVATSELVRTRDVAQARQMMERFAPQTGVLSIPLGLAGDIKSAAEWQGLKTTGLLSYRGVPHLRLVPDLEGDGRGNPLEAALFEQETGRLTQVTWVTRGGRVTFIYADYRLVADDVVVPFSVRVERNGGMVEAITIGEFKINPKLARSLFSEPSKIKGRKH